MLSTRRAQREHALLELIGWLGVGFVICAYLLNTLGILSSQTMLYLTMNGAGAVGIMVHSYHRRDYQPLVLNMIWLLIAIFGMIRSFDVAGAAHLISLVGAQALV